MDASSGFGGSTYVQPTSPLGTAGRIPESVFRGATLAMTALALIIAVARTTIRIKYQRRLYIDDGFFLVAAAALIASLALLWDQLDQMYLAEAFITNQNPMPTLPADWFGGIIQALKIEDAFLVVSWSCLFLIKFSFIFFFRTLIRRMPAMMVYWYIVIAVTFAVWVFGCGAVFATCPYFDSRAVSCSQGSEFEVAVAYSVAMIVLDIVTDCLILVIPFYLISKIRVHARQKLILAFSLCLSVVIVLVSIACAAGIHSPTTKAIDVTWELFWQMIEAAVAVTMCGLISFRSLFIAHAARVRNSPPTSADHSQPWPWLRRLIRTRIRSSNAESPVSPLTTSGGNEKQVLATQDARRAWRWGGARARLDTEHHRVPNPHLSGLMTSLVNRGLFPRRAQDIMLSNSPSNFQPEPCPSAWDGGESGFVSQDGVSSLHSSDKILSSACGTGTVSRGAPSTVSIGQGRDLEVVEAFKPPNLRPPSYDEERAIDISPLTPTVPRHAFFSQSTLNRSLPPLPPLEDMRNYPSIEPRDAKSRLHEADSGTPGSGNRAAAVEAPPARSYWRLLLNWRLGRSPRRTAGLSANTSAPSSSVEASNSAIEGLSDDDAKRDQSRDDTSRPWWAWPSSATRARWALAQTQNSTRRELPATWNRSTVRSTRTIAEKPATLNNSTNRSGRHTG